MRIPAGPACRNLGCGWGRFGRGASDAIGCGCPAARAVLADRDRQVVAGQVAAGEHDGAARGGGGVDAGFGGDLGEPARSVAPDADLGRLGRAREQHVVAVGAEDAEDLQAGRGERLGVLEPGGRGDDQPPRVVADRGPDDVPAGELGGQAVDDVGPVRVGVLADQPAGSGVDQPHDLLIAGRHDHQRRLVPGHGGQVGEGGPVPLDLLELGRGAVAGLPGDGGEHQRHVGVGGARGRVAHLRSAPCPGWRGRRCTTAGPGTRRPGRSAAGCRRATTSSRGNGPSPRPRRTPPGRT